MIAGSANWRNRGPRHRFRNARSLGQEQAEENVIVAIVQRGDLVINTLVMLGIEAKAAMFRLQNCRKRGLLDTQYQLTTSNTEEGRRLRSAPLTVVVFASPSAVSKR
ncbi:hypothetical protein ASG42_28470 [Rhizobium sp. Leaf391]|nr:hypothetical protein ASG42_28470 [Rhizobium sp. Leaf391]